MKYHYRLGIRLRKQVLKRNIWRLTGSLSLCLILLLAQILPATIADAETFGYPDQDAVVCGYSSWCKNNSSTSSRGYAYRNCTDFVAWKLAAVNGFTISWGLGHAKTWGTRADAPVNTTPAPGSVAWRDDGEWGHVAWVQSVNGNNITIQEYNWDLNGNGRTNTVHKSAFDEFIHFKDLSGFITHPAAIKRGNSMDVFYKEIDGDLANVGWQPGDGWSAPQPLDSNLQGNPDAVSRDTDNMEVVFVDTASQLRTKGWNSTAGWIGSIVRSNDAMGDPIIISRSSNSMDVFWRTNSGALMNRGWDTANGWMNTQELATGIDSNPTAVARGSNSMDVFYRDGGALMNVGWNASGGWSNPNPLETVNVTGDPVVVARTASDMDVFYRTTSNDLANKGWSAGTGWRPLATRSYGDVLSDPTATSRGSGAMEVAFRSNNNTLKSVGWDVNVGWGLSQSRGSGIYGEPEIINRGTSVMEIFYKQINHLTDSGWNAGSGWAETDIADTGDIQ